ncbi:hypothetical protein [Nocardioides sp. LHG3406-4]|uniref:hypothetical protein n=1 Tax=Nocardioides sp. LHG3406-4 TaxID=2804575 RepID=UPI003CF3DB93
MGTSTIGAPSSQLRFAAGTTVVGDSHHRRGSSWSLARGSVLVPLVRSAGLVSLRVADDGRTVVWAERVADDPRRVTAYDVAAGTPSGSIDVPVEVSCCTGEGELTLYGVLPARRVVWSAGGSTVAWRPGEPAAVPVRLAGRQLSLVGWPGGVMWRGRGVGTRTMPGAFATVADDGTVTRAGQVPTDRLGAWSPDGASYAYPGRRDGRVSAKGTGDVVWVQDARTGRRRALAVPTDRRMELVAWESATELLLAAWVPYSVAFPDSTGLRALVRCLTDTGGCERVAGAPVGMVTLPAPGPS